MTTVTKISEISRLYFCKELVPGVYETMKQIDNDPFNRQVERLLPFIRTPNLCIIDDLEHYSLIIRPQKGPRSTHFILVSSSLTQKIVGHIMYTIETVMTRWREYDSHGTLNRFKIKTIINHQDLKLKDQSYQSIRTWLESHIIHTS